MTKREIKRLYKASKLGHSRYWSDRKLSLTEAKNKAVIGDTVDEQTIGNEEVVNRELA